MIALLTACHLLKTSRPNVIRLGAFWFDQNFRFEFQEYFLGRMEQNYPVGYTRVENDKLHFCLHNFRKWGQKPPEAWPNLPKLFSKKFSSWNSRKFRLKGSLFGNSNNFQIFWHLFQEIFVPFDPRFVNFGIFGSMESNKGFLFLQCIGSQHCEGQGDWMRVCMEWEINTSLNSKMFVTHLILILLAPLWACNDAKLEGLNRNREKI